MDSVNRFFIVGLVIGIFLGLIIARLSCMEQNRAVPSSITTSCGRDHREWCISWSNSGFDDKPQVDWKDYRPQCQEYSSFEGTEASCRKWLN